ncbi:lipid scramblase CLPTM1L-like [Zophobas morio]|uniref:lipid scramblase CLPTM1L-like n=1 Tax=Zophobas morio TaxID=2755281 RepID=UPI003083E367
MSIFNQIAIGAAFAYGLLLSYQFYYFYFPKTAENENKGISNIYKIGQKFEMSVFASQDAKPCSSLNNCLLVFNQSNLLYKHDKSQELTAFLSIPSQEIIKILRIKRFYLHVYLTEEGKRLSNLLSTSNFNNEVTYQCVNLLKLIKPLKQARNLLSANISINDSSLQPQWHIARSVDLRLVVDQTIFPQDEIPYDISMHLKVSLNKRNYLPIIYNNMMLISRKNYIPFSQFSDPAKPTTAFSLLFQWSPISLGRFRIMNELQAGFKLLEQHGFSELDIEAIGDLFTRYNPAVLFLTLFVSLVHLLFDFLAFKNDVVYWKKRKNLRGISSRAVLLEAVTEVIVFLYLLDNDASKLVVIPVGIQSLINLWKLKKALRLTISIFPFSISLGEVTAEEEDTEVADAKATGWMMKALLPLMSGYALYSLWFDEHRGWYSWILSTLTGYIYLFGFILMLPQLFINYRMKSVAHLPWRALTYKAFNTFIDDVFAFIIKMPMMHRLACFRDDIVFFCFLYQLWIYPVDHSRINEFGVSGEDLGLSNKKKINEKVESEKHSDACKSSSSDSLLRKRNKAA